MTGQTAGQNICAALRMRAYSCVAPDGRHGMRLSVIDTAGLYPNGLCAQWLGDEAAAFLEQHQAELVPGRCLDLEIYYVQAFNGELHARVRTCTLAVLPSSWLKHAENVRIEHAQPHQPTTEPA